MGRASKRAKDQQRAARSKGLDMPCYRPEPSIVGKKNRVEHQHDITKHALLNQCLLRINKYKGGEHIMTGVTRIGNTTRCNEQFRQLIFKVTDKKFWVKERKRKGFPEQDFRVRLPNVLCFRFVVFVRQPCYVSVVWLLTEL